jgi:hypothetical protein
VADEKNGSLDGIINGRKKREVLGENLHERHFSTIKFQVS